MAYPIEFHKDDAEQWLQAIRSGAPLPLPASGKWSIHAMLALAGVFHYAVKAYGPLHHALSPEQEEKLPPEHREAREETLLEDLALAIEFHARLVMWVREDKFDAAFEPFVQAVVYRDASGEKSLVPARGFRGVKPHFRESADG
jgi:hypothetical protein